MPPVRQPRHHDPLGPTRHMPIGRATSPWKRHWMVHGRKWLFAGGGVLVLAFCGFIVWPVSLSMQYYSHRTRSVPPPAPSPPTTELQTASRAVDGPVRLDIELKKLITGEPVIINRDMAAIVQRRLEDAGLESDSAGENKVRVVYSESRGDSVDVQQPTSDGTWESVNSTRATDLRVIVLLERPNQPTRQLGETWIRSVTEAIQLPRTADRTSLAQLKRQAYLQAYQRALQFLRTVDMPTPAATTTTSASS